MGAFPLPCQARRCNATQRLLACSLYCMTSSLRKYLRTVPCFVPLQVREAMTQLLVAVSRSRSLHFYEVVPLDALFSVMAVGARCQRTHTVNTAAGE